MKITFQTRENILDIKLSGEIDHHTCVELREKIDREYQKTRAKHMMIDFEEVKFMDSAGIGLLMGRYRSVVIGGGNIAIYHVSNKIDTVLKMAGLYKLVKTYDNREKALSAFM